MAKAPTFESRLLRLQEVVEKLSSDELPLEESIALFKEGQTLLKQCGEQLAKARNEVKLLTENGESLSFMAQSSEED